MRLHIRHIAMGLVLTLFLSVFSACGWHEPEDTETPNPAQVGQPQGSPAPFVVAQETIHEIVTLTSITRMSETDFRAECEIIYSSNPGRSEYGTLYFKGEIYSEVEEGGTYLVAVYDGSAVVHSMVAMENGRFHLGWTDEFGWDENVIGNFHALTVFNQTVKFYLNHPEEQIPSVPKEPLEGDATAEDVIEFFESIKVVYKEWTNNR